MCCWSEHFSGFFEMNLFRPGIFLKRAKDKAHLNGRGKKKGRQESEDRAVGEKCGHIAFWKAKEAVSRRKTQSAVLAWQPCSGDEEGTSDTWESSFSSWGMTRGCSVRAAPRVMRRTLRTKSSQSPVQRKLRMASLQSNGPYTARPSHSDFSTRVTSGKRTSRDKSLSKGAYGDKHIVSNQWPQQGEDISPTWFIH